MFGLLNSLAKAAVAVVVTPVAVVADVLTVGGLVTDQEKSYTEQAGGAIVDNLKDAIDPKK